MFTLTRSFLAVFACALLVARAGAEPRGRVKQVTPADIDRLEKKIEAQQELITKLIKLHQQFLQALSSLVDGSPAPVSVDKPVDKVIDAPPPEKRLEKVVARPEPLKIKKPKPSSSGIVVGKVTGAPNAIIYIEDVVATARGATAEMRQEGRRFAPQVLVVQQGTKVDFPNRDAIFHNVFSLSPDYTFDLGSYPQGESKTVTMSRPGVVTVYCNMHPQMIGHILVVPNGNYVRAGSDGFFRLANVPVGSHRIVAWAPNSKPVAVTRTVTDAEPVTIEVALKKGRDGIHTKKDGLPYGSYEQ